MAPKNRTLSLLRTLGSTAVRAGAEALRDRMRPSADSPNANAATDRLVGMLAGAAPSAAAERLVRGLDDLKGAAMKMGQMLSLADEDLLPPGWKPALARLQSEATARPFAEIAPIIESAVPGGLGAFVTFEEKALHAASIGQVHRATLPDGTRVAVKVRYPDLDRWVRADVKAMKRLLKLANILPREGDFDAVFAEVEAVFRQEIDFAQEADHYRNYRAHFAANEGILVPRVIDSLSGSQVLVTEWVEGVNIDRWVAQAGADRSDGHPRHALAARVMGLLFEEMFSLKTLQTDPNPANFLVTQEGRLVLLDFGAARRLDNVLVEGYRDLSAACVCGTRPDIERVCERMGLLIKADTLKAREAFLRMMVLATEPFEHSLYDFGASDLMRKLRTEGIAFVREAGFRPPPPGLVFLNRRVVGTQMLMERLAGRFDARAVLMPYLKG